MKKPVLLFLTLLLCAPAYAQEPSLDLLYESAPGTRPSAIFSDGFESGNLSRLDFNGDSTPDLIMTREDALGNLDGLLVINAASLDTLWRVQDVGTTLGLAERDGMKLLGFADADGDNTREAFFADNEIVVIVNPGDNSQERIIDNQAGKIRVIGLEDLTDDGFEDIIIALLDARQVQVWGIEN